MANYDHPKRSARERVDSYLALRDKAVEQLARITGIQSCTTSKDYWSDCDG